MQHPIRGGKGGTTSGTARSRRAIVVLSFLLLTAASARAQAPPDAGCREAVWGMDEIAASRVVAPAPASGNRTADAVATAGRILISEAGGEYLTVLDGERLEPVFRFPAPAGPVAIARLSSDGRHGFLASRDGWVAKIDLRDQVLVAKARSGFELTGIALSADGRYLAVGNARPCTLALLSAADLAPLKVVPGADAKGQLSSRIGSVQDAGPRGSFLVTLEDVREVWEVFYKEDAPKIYRGFVHSHEAGMTEGIAESGWLGARHIAVDRPLRNLALAPDRRNSLGASSGEDGLVVVNLTVGRPIATIPMADAPALAPDVPGRWQGRPVLAVLHRAAARLSLVDPSVWRVLKTIELQGPAVFARGYQDSPHVWVGTQTGDLEIIDRRTWEVERTFHLAGGQRPVDAVFTRGGERILISVTEPNGAVIAFDARTFAGIKRIPLVGPSIMHTVHDASAMAGPDRGR